MKKIPLTRGMFALVDGEDFETFGSEKWYALKNGRTYYAVRSKPRKGGFPRKKLHLHREILGFVEGDGRLVDHINGDGLDCRRVNLREATSLQNATNRCVDIRSKSGYRGVSFNSAMKKWKSNICRRGVKKHLGYYHSKKIAAITYNNVAKILHGKYARINPL